MTSFFKIIFATCLAMALAVGQVAACTGIRLTAEDGAVVYGRSMEWGAFDLNSRVAIIPRGHSFTGLTPDGENGRTWTATYGAVAIDMMGHDWFTDGLNEAGLAVGMFYHPGFAEYPAYASNEASTTISAVDVAGYILTQFKTIEDVRAGMTDLRVVGVLEDLIGLPDPAHWMVTDSSGQSIVIEYADGEMVVFDAPLGVITNAPTYDWHMINLRNFISVSPVALPPVDLKGNRFAPLGEGSGMIGLPGDFTPPSRFVRAVAWTQTARHVPDAGETLYEALRILDNFDLPLNATVGADTDGANPDGMRSSTIWTTVWDLENRTLYFHTQHNRRLRMVSLAGLDFATDDIRHIAMDDGRRQDIEDLTPTQ